MPTHPLPVQEEGERGRRGHVILTGNRPAHAHSQVDLRKRDLSRSRSAGLSMRDIFEHRLDHPTRPARRRREHGDDGAVRLEQAAERRQVRRDVDRARNRAGSRVLNSWRCCRRAICDTLQEGRRGCGGRGTGRAAEHGVDGGAQRGAEGCRKEVGR